jgi:hypothetical protein
MERQQIQRILGAGAVRRILLELDRYTHRLDKKKVEVQQEEDL